MVFSSPLFLFVFLPIVLFLYYALARRYRNWLLLLASLVFYAWGEPKYITLMIVSILFNWLGGLMIERAADGMRMKLVLAFVVVINLLVLAHFKYAFFLATVINDVVGPAFDLHLHTEPLSLPVGISFFTFHAISYVVDIFRKKDKALKNPLDMGLYIAFFPQLVAGPIIRFHDIAEQIKSRSNTLSRFCSGIERFTFGLGKKVLIANALGQIADQAFSVSTANISTSTAWLGIVCYTLQIYFDFSGYSDMAIGLARMFGFELTENFNYPYIAKSIREFWRRWHLSLSTWFRDYLYIPLGGNRVSAWRAKLNLFIVFFLCGMWHGASWNFALWGMFHGVLLVVERGRVGDWLDACPRVIAGGYTLLMVMVGWVLFRAETLSGALGYYQAMLGGGGGHGLDPQLALLVDDKAVITLVIAVLLATPVATAFSSDWQHRRFPGHAHEPFPSYVNLGAGLARGRGAGILSVLLCGAIIVLCAGQLAISTYNPFIYFRF